jgi:hypothetical protein
MYTAKIVISVFINIRQERLKQVTMHTVHSSDAEDAKKMATEFIIANKPMFCAMRDRGITEPRVIITAVDSYWMGELLQDGDMRI